jgi:hypothetical protein
MPFFCCCSDRGGVKGTHRVKSKLAFKDEIAALLASEGNNQEPLLANDQQLPMEMNAMSSEPRPSAIEDTSVQLRLSYMQSPVLPVEIMYPPLPGEDTMNKYNKLGIQIEFSSDALYAAEIYMTDARPTQRMAPGMLLTHINEVDQGTKTYQQVFGQISNRPGGGRVKLTFAPGSKNNAVNNSQLVEFNMPYAAFPGDRLKAATPDGMNVEILMGGDSPAHPGEVYMMLVARAIPIEPVVSSKSFFGSREAKPKKKGAYTQTVGELQLLEEMDNIRQAIADGDTSADRQQELAQLELLRKRVQTQGLKSEMNILRKEQESQAATGDVNAPASDPQADFKERERLRRMRLLEDELRRLQQ